MARGARHLATIAVLAFAPSLGFALDPRVEGAEPPPPSGPSPDPSPDPGPSPKDAPPAERKTAESKPKPKPKAPPRTMALPQAGDYPAGDILAIAGTLRGLEVYLENDRVAKTRVIIDRELAGTQLGSDEVAILLAAHGVYLFDHVDPKAGQCLMASRNPKWEPVAPRFTQVIEVESGSFDKVVAKIEAAVDEENRKLAEDTKPIVAVPSARVGKVIVSAPSQETLDRVVRRVSASVAERDPERPKYFVYGGRNRKVEALETELLEKLEDGERKALSIVVASRGNRLLLRCSPSLGQKALAILKDLDSLDPPKRDPATAPPPPTAESGTGKTKAPGESPKPPPPEGEPRPGDRKDTKPEEEAPRVDPPRPGE